ncbi:hypothetical protein L1987_45393 [Smallanthus sonchifolius]|uniref:Uncharacterized protein n=1 Tax=Smallanthus sonchifolius TaxID=185202 RepID=A0ACB9FXS5_9ASTR|nr:hypothetical protein L1987_45393 [Smallanthus sonchifolius]
MMVAFKLCAESNSASKSPAVGVSASSESGASADSGASASEESGAGGLAAESSTDGLGDEPSLLEGEDEDGEEPSDGDGALDGDGAKPFPGGDALGEFAGVSAAILPYGYTKLYANTTFTNDRVVINAGGNNPWSVKIKYTNGQMSFSQGWSKVVEDMVLQIRNILVFTPIDNSTFSLNAFHFDKEVQLGQSFFFILVHPSKNHLFTGSDLLSKNAIRQQ